MENLVKDVVEKLMMKKETIATMESCTGGYLASEITNISGSSEIFSMGFVTYSNESKEKLGVSKETIELYSVYSNQVSEEMAKCATMQAKSIWGIGTTGQIGRPDPNNPNQEENKVYYSLYNSQTNKIYSFARKLEEKNRNEKKADIVQNIFENLDTILKG